MGDWLSIIRAVGDAASRFFGLLEVKGSRSSVYPRR